jgi:hypothetical protein
MGLISYLKTVKSPRERFREHWQAGKEKWRSYNRAQKVLWAAQASTYCFAVLVLVMMMLVDSMFVLVQLRLFTWTWAGVAILHVLLARLMEKRWFREPPAKTVDGFETSKPIEPGWKSHGILFASYYILSWIPFTGMLKVLVNLFAISGFYALLRLPFIDYLLLEMYPIFWTGLAFFATAFGYVHWMLGIPLICTLGSWCARIIYREHLDRKRNGRHDLGRRVKVSLLSMITFLVLGSFTIWWVLSSANIFYTVQDNPTRLTLYSKLAPGSVAKHTAGGVSALAPGISGRVRASSCPARKASIVHSNSQLQSAIAKTPHPVVFEYPSSAQEATVFYYRYPYLSYGTVKSLGYQTLVLGKTETHYIPGTEDMGRFFDNALQKMPGFSGGLFDVILLDGVDGAKEGKGIFIVDIETFPVGSPDETFDPTDGILGAALKSARRIRTGLMQLWMGIYNVMAGNQINVFRLMFRLPRFISRAYTCGSGNLECLLGRP